MEIKNYFAQDAQGNIMPSANCYLYLPGTTTLATGLVDGNGAPISNPFLASNIGQVTFGAPNGVYDLRISQGARDTTIEIQCADLLQAMNETASFLGAHSAPPASGNSGEPLQIYYRYFNTVDQLEYLYKSTGWVANNLDGQLLATSQGASLLGAVMQDGSPGTIQQSIDSVDSSLRQDLAAPTGADYIGWKYSQITQAIRTAGEKLSGLELDIWEFADSAVGYAPGGDPATWDWGPCVTLADARLNAVSMNGGTVRFRQGVYGLGSNAVLTGLGKNIIGAGIRATEFRALPGYAGDMVTFTGSSYCVARGFKVVGDGGATQRGLYMPYRSDSGVTLENRIDSIQVEKVAEGFALENPVHCTVSDCRTDRACTLFGIRSQFKAGVGAGQGGTNLRLIGNWFQSHEVTGTSAYINSNTSFSSIGTQFEHGRVGLVLRACPGASVISPLFEDCGMHFSLQGCTNPVFTGVNLDSGTTPDLGIAVQPLIDIDGGDGIKILGLYSFADDKSYIDALIRFTNTSYGVYPTDVLIDEYSSIGAKGLLGSANVSRLRVVKDGTMTMQGMTMQGMRLQMQTLTSPPASPAVGEEFNADGVAWTPVTGGRARVIYSGAGVYTKIMNF